MVPRAPDPKPLSEALADRVLTRASELDAALASGVTVSELREAAREAGISEQAFEEALRTTLAPRETPRTTALPAIPSPTSRTAVRRLAAAALACVVAGVAVLRFGGPAPAKITAGPPVTEEALLLTCLTADEAATLVRPMLTLPGNTIEIDRRAPRVLTVRATAGQLERIRTKLAAYEQPGAAACTTRPSPP